MRSHAPALILALSLLVPGIAPAQSAPRTLVAVLAHADDESPVGPVLARYAREGVRVYLIVATDGAQGASNTTIPAGPELAHARAEEAQCSASALGAAAPILLGFPDAKLGDFLSDRSLLYRLTDRVAQELARLQPDVLVTWGPEGGYGHPDHRLVSDMVTQLVRAGPPGVPERLFYMHLPIEAIRAVNLDQRAAPLLIPQAKYVTMRVSFTPEDLKASQRSMACHKTQFAPAMLERMLPGMERVWNGAIAFVPWSPASPGTDLFR